MPTISKNAHFILHNLAWILIRGTTAANQTLTKLNEKFDKIVIDHYVPPDDEDAFKKRGEAFENQYIRKLDYELTEKLRRKKSAARKERVREKLASEREKLFREEQKREEEEEAEKLAKKLEEANGDLDEKK